MPPPKDPNKLAEYKARQRANALANGFGVTGLTCQRGRKQPKEEVEKRTETLRRVSNTPEHRQLMSQVARNCGNGKWMVGRKLPHISESNREFRTGKSYIELYGRERAVEEVQKRLHGNKLHWDKKGRKYKEPPYHDSAEYARWRTKVFQRDNYTCQRCGRKGNIQAHHIKPWATFLELRYVVSNGMTFCTKPCHRDIHREIKECARFLAQLRK